MYIVSWYDFDDDGCLYLVDENGFKCFDDALKAVAFSWGLPFEIWKEVPNPFVRNATCCQTVARSAAFAEV